MAHIRRTRAIAALVVLASVGLLAQPAAASHENAIVDCGDAGTFTLRTTPGGGFFWPGPTSVLLFDGGGTLSVLIVFRNDVLLYDDPATGVENNAVEEVTCSFTLANGDELEITGVYTGR
jgi:hypothetical protein